MISSLLLIGRGSDERWTFECEGRVEEGNVSGRGKSRLMSEPDSLHLAQLLNRPLSGRKLCSGGRFVSGHLLACLSRPSFSR